MVVRKCLELVDLAEFGKQVCPGLVSVTCVNYVQGGKEVAWCLEFSLGSLDQLARWGCLEIRRMAWVV